MNQRIEEFLFKFQEERAIKETEVMPPETVALVVPVSPVTQAREASKVNPECQVGPDIQVWTAYPEVRV